MDGKQMTTGSKCRYPSIIVASFESGGRRRSKGRRMRLQESTAPQSWQSEGARREAQSQQEKPLAFCVVEKKVFRSLGWLDCKG